MLEIRVDLKFSATFQGALQTSMRDLPFGYCKTYSYLFLSMVSCCFLKPASLLRILFLVSILCSDTDFPSKAFFIEVFRNEMTIAFKVKFLHWINLDHFSMVSLYWELKPNTQTHPALKSKTIDNLFNLFSNITPRWD